MKLFLRLVILIFILSIRITQGQFLHVQDKSILDGNENQVILRGMGLGGWMLQEGYMLQLSSVANPQHEIWALFEDAIGVENTNTFYDAWLDNHCTKTDVDSLASWGFNSIRLPMHYNLYTLSIQEEPIAGENTWLDKGFAMTDSLLNWCEANEIYLILDLHAAPGGQGHDGAISDYNPAFPSLWEDEANKQKTITLWRKLAERYAYHPWIGGYDLINETNWGFDDPNDLHGQGEQNNVPLRQLLVDITTAIREVDNNHIIYIEGNSWANNYNGIFPPWDDNMVASFHKYWSINDVESIQWMLAFRDEYNIPLWLGESGENSNTWYKDAITICEQNNIGWAWWPMKKIGLNNVLEIKKTQGYQDLIDYWEGNADQPTQEVAFASLMELAENTKIENCIYHPDVVDAMIRQPHSNEAIPTKNHNITDGYKLFMVDYDMGGNDIGYHDKVVANYHVSSGSYTAWNLGWVYRNDGVDIEICTDENTNGFNLGFTEAGEWLQYTINVEASGTYHLNIRTASAGDQNKLSLYVNDLPVSKDIAIPNSGGWQSWQTTNVTDIYLSQGTNVLMLNIDEGEYNVNYIEFIGPRVAEAVQPDFLSSSVEESNASMVLMSYNQPFKPISNFEDFSVKANGLAAGIDTAHVLEGQDQIIVVELTNPLVYGDFAYISYSGSIVQTANDIVLDTFSDTQIEINLSNPLDKNRIPGKVEAEDMSINQGFRTEACFDEGGGLATGWSDPNDYLMFDIDVLETGTYQITYRHSGLGGTGQVNVYKLLGENEELIETIFFNSTLGWQNWSDKVGGEFDLEKGVIQIKVEVVAANFNLNYLNFDLVNVPAESSMGFIQGETNSMGDKIILDFNKPILESSISTTGFILVVNGEEVTFSSIELEGPNSLAIMLDQPSREHDIVKVGYGEGGTIVSDNQEALSFFALELIKNIIIELNLLAIPGKIEAEAYVVNKGFEFETCTDTGGGQNAGYTDSGDYLDFDVIVDEEGVYDIFYRVASESAGGSLSLQKVVNGSATTLNTISFTATGGWQNWTTVEDQVTLEKGVQKFRLLSKGSLFNINWVEFKKASEHVTGFLNAERTGFKVYPNPTTNQFVVRVENSIINADQIRICNLSGQLVDYNILKINTHEFMIKHKLKPGLYIMSMNSVDKYISRKLIVK